MLDFVAPWHVALIERLRRITPRRACQNFAFSIDCATSTSTGRSTRQFSTRLRPQPLRDRSNSIEGAVALTP
jgi:hypothetical protein